MKTLKNINMNEKSDQSHSKLIDIIYRLEKSELQLKAANQQLEANNQRLIASEQETIKYANELGERIKELNCLHKISESIQTRDSLEDILQDIVNIIPPSWQYPEIACAKLYLWDKEYTTLNYADSNNKMSSDIIVNKKIVGRIDVCYLQNTQNSNPFLKEEITLLDNITERLGRVIERNKAQEELATNNQQLNALNQQLDASNQQLIANEQQLRAANQQLAAYNQQLIANENALKISEEKYKCIIYNTLSCVVVYKAIDDGNNFVFTDFNRAAEKLEKTHREDVIGKKVTDVFPRVEEFGLFDVFKNVYKTGKPEHYPVTFYADNKTQRYRENYVFKISSGEIIAVYQDVTERKKYETEITILSTAVKQSPSIIAITDLKGNAKYVNPKFTESTGYSREEIINKNVHILKSGDQSQDDYTKLWNTITAGKTWTGEFHNKKKNGELYWESATISPIFDATGKIINYLKVAEDITTRKKAEEDLVASAEKYKELIETTSEGFWLLDSNKKTIDMNQSLCNMLGYTRDEILGCTPMDFVDEENKKIFEFQLTRAAHDKNRIYDIELKSKSGINIPTNFNASSIINKNGEYEGSFAFVTDISNRKHNEDIQKILYNISNAVNTTNSVEELINQIQIELSTIIDTTNFYVALYNAEDDTLSLPYYADEKDSFDRVPAGKTLSKYVIETKKSLLADIALKQKFVDEGILEHKGSLSKLWLGVPLKTDGIVNGVFAVQSYTNENAFTEDDVKMLEFVAGQISISIERKTNEQNLKTALAKSKESDRLKSAFLATISHELRTPLNSIIGFSSLISNELDINDILEFAKTIKLSGEHLLNIIDDLFDITLIESGETKVVKQEVNLNTILRNIHTFIKAEQKNLKKESIALNIIIPPNSDELVIQTDPLKIKKILINLLKNALKFTHKGYIYFGYITEIRNNNHVVKFFVKDTGIGIQQDKQEFIFGLFKQIDDSYTRTYGGIGVGLSISKKLTELLNGNIWFESKEGVGSTFYFTIPKDIDIVPSKPKPKLPINKIDLSGKTILIVEDDIDSYEYLKILLNQYGSNTLWAQNGKEAIELCKQHSGINMILMDINMKVMNGYLATREIKKIKPTLPIIAQTALAISGDREKALDAGCDDYITKPLNKEKLLAMINKYIEK